VSGGPIPLAKWPADDPGPRVTRGTKKPRAIAWFGFSAFWGHLRHLVASAIATENIDSRQWMIPDAPDVLLGRVLEIIGPRATRGTAQAIARGEGATLSEAMGGEVWIDFVSDTGDDVTASEAVAELFVAEYEVDDPDATGERLVLPRGDILFLGGDLAYPVATVLEMTRRLVEPWNKVLMKHASGGPRVLLAVPGNHDWYDGLDGFSRLCQAPCAFEDRAPTSSDPDPLRPEPAQHPVLAWAEAFARGDQVKKPTALALAGYLAVQRASYFRLPLAPGLDLFGVDRQLKSVDPRQQAYFAIPGAPARVVVMPDPARAWGEQQPHGKATLDALGITMAKSPNLLLAGDIHHYERSEEGPSIHVVAGGGGAFLHGARIASDGEYRTLAEFPGPRASWKLLLELPLFCGLGRAGFILPAVFALCDLIALAERFRDGARASAAVALAISLIVAFGTALLVGWRRHRAVRVVPFATGLGLAIGAIPVAIGIATDRLATHLIGHWVSPVAFVVALVLATFASSVLFGVMLMLIARMGLNHAQAYAAMGSPGYKHFVRLRVKAGDHGMSHVDAWVIGIVDPIARPTAVLVDGFRFDPFKER
jgi:hypothetical protein